MPKAKVYRKEHMREGVTYRVGDELTVSERELANLSDRLQRVEEKPKSPGRPKKRDQESGSVSDDGEANGE